MKHINNSDITIVLQGSTLAEYKGKRCIEYSINSIKKILPNAKIILSTWDGEEIPLHLQKKVDRIIYSKDPGYKTRNGKPDGKPNNVNRQIVSTINGLKQVETKYAMKMRTDFVLTSDGFLKYFDKFNDFNNEYQIFEKRILCLMLGSAKPKAKYYNLPFHISDFTTFGLTSDLQKLYDIPLVTDEEFDWFLIHTEIKPDTLAVNRFGGEQSIWINCLIKNDVDVKCKYSTHVNDEIVEQSEKYLINNFVPISYKRYGVYPLKKGLRPKKFLKYYLEYYTFNEWLKLYKKLVNPNIKVSKFDYENFIIQKVSNINNNILYPKFIKNLFFYILNKQL